MKTDVYISKKNPDVTAKILKKPNDVTVILEYLTGDKKGSTTSISTGILKRYWKRDGERTVEDILNVDMDEINKPYPEPKEKKYIPKPEAVVEYEERKKRSNKILLDFELPANYEVFADILAERHVGIKRVNSGYISMPDSSKLKLLSNGIGVLASTELAEQLVTFEMTSKPCIEKGTPFRFDVCTQKQFDDLIFVLSNLYKNNKED